MKPRQFQKLLGVGAALTILTMLAACGSQKAKDTPEGGDGTPPAADAGTDAVPAQPTAELPPPAAAASPDPAAAPAASTDPSAVASPAPSSMPSQAAPSTPAPVETPVVPAPAASTGASSEQTQSDSYTVKRGDTLMKIAFEVYGDVYKWKEIYEANKDKIKDPNFVSNDVVLRVARPATPVTTEQNGEKYLIKKGDTLGRISSSVYGTKSKWKVLWETNKQLIHDPNKIFAGFYLYYNTTNSSPASLASQGNSSSPSTDANSGSSAPRSPSAVPGGEAGSSAAQKNNATAAQSPAAPAAPSALPPTTQESAPAAQAPNSAEAPPVLPPAQPQN